MADDKKCNPTDSKKTHCEKAKSSSTQLNDIDGTAEVAGGDSVSPVDGIPVTELGSARREELAVPATSPIHVVSMNANGPNDGNGTARRRRQVISDVISNNSPDVVLFQEFKWRVIRERTWTNTPIPKRYEYTGFEEASILYDGDQIQMQELKAIDLQRPLEELKRKGNVSQDFAPLARCCIRLMEIKVTALKCILISWHGKYKVTDGRKIIEFKNLQVYMNELSERLDLPILMGGDFNIRMAVIKNSVLPEFILHEYTPSKRRLGKTNDFFLTSRPRALGGVGLSVTNVKSIDISNNEQTNAEDPQYVLDHDPISATVSLALYQSKSNHSEATGQVSPSLKYPIQALTESDKDAEVKADPDTGEIEENETQETVKKVKKEEVKEKKVEKEESNPKKTVKKEPVAKRYPDSAKKTAKETKEEEFWRLWKELRRMEKEREVEKKKKEKEKEKAKERVKEYERWKEKEMEKEKEKTKEKEKEKAKQREIYLKEKKKEKEKKANRGKDKDIQKKKATWGDIGCAAMKYTLYGGAVVLLGVGAVTVVPLVLSGLGSALTGIAAVATKLMSSVAVVKCGGVAAGCLVKLLPLAAIGILFAKKIYKGSVGQCYYI